MNDAERIEYLRGCYEGMRKQRDRYIAAMLWMRDQDPQMVDAAVEKFELDLDG